MVPVKAFKMADNFLAQEICNKTAEEVEKKTKIALGRRLSRRLSLVTKVPSLINSKLKQDNGILEPYTGEGKYFNVTVIAPDKTQRIIECQKGQSVRSALSLILNEFGVDNFKLYLAGSLAVVDEEADAIYLYDNILIVEEQPSAENDSDECRSTRQITEKILNEELEYIKILNSASELYDNSVIIYGDQNESGLSVIFKSLNSLAVVCIRTVNNLKSLLDSNCEPVEKIGCCFNDQFWEEYDGFLKSYKISKRLLRQRKLQDEHFVQLCRLRQGAAKYSLEQIVDLPVQRLSEYERYFESLLAESRSENQQLNVEEINNVKAKCKQAAKRGQRESDLERIQDLFPNDCLRLYDAEALTMKVKGLMRKRSGAATRLQRALSTKSLRSESPPPSQKTPISSIEQRTFLMEAPVQFSTGVQSQDRHLFLFNDLLLIAKARSGGNFKLKEKVRISEIWLTKSCLDDVSELNKSEDTSFVMGWPTTNVVVTFSTQAARDLWWNKLLEVFRSENEKEPCSTNIQVMYYDLNTNIEYCKTFSVGPDDTARDCIRVALEHLEMRNLERANFQLWAKTARDESPYPLIGHERPFAIKLSCLRDSLSSEDGFDLDHCNNIHDPVARCHFILRSNVKNAIIDNKKSSKKSSTRAMKIGQVFRRSKDQSSCLFGLPLCKLTDGETLPKPIMSMLYQVFAKGPFVQGIFRKSANARQVRELRDKLDAGVDVTWEHVPVLVTAALLKEFLRSLPDPLLTTALYPQWRTAVEERNLNTKLRRLKDVLGQLPKPNHLLLIHFVCVLYHIARRSCHTLMSAANLGVCVGPSLLWSDCPNVSDDLRIVPSVVECLITHCEYLCGSHVPSLLGDLRDSGTEESDSMKRDDSSIDSLECSPPPRKDKMSLSRDSGLTMSDSQLYTPDEEESGSTSSSGYDPAFESHAKVSSSVSMPVNYVRVYGGWEERLNPNYFQRQAWFRQRSRRMNSQSANKNDVRRTASEESLLDNTAEPPPAPPRRNKTIYEYDHQTPVYPRKNAVIIPRRIDVSSKSSESELDRSKGDSDSSSSFQTTPTYRKESNKAPVPPKSEPFIVERRSLPFNALSINCDSASSSAAKRENHYSNVCVNSSGSRANDDVVIPFGSGDYYYAVREQIEDAKNVECEDSSTLSDEDCTPHVSRSNSRGNEVVNTLKYSPAAAHTDTCVVRGRVKRKEERAAARSRSLPPPPPYRPPPPATSRRAPITSYYLGDCNQIQNYVIRTYMDEESYV